MADAIATGSSYFNLSSGVLKEPHPICEADCIYKNSMSSMEDNIEDSSCIKETNAMEIEALLHQIATSLQSAAEGYMSLASHINKLNPYKLP